MKTFSIEQIKLLIKLFQVFYECILSFLNFVSVIMRSNQTLAEPPSEASYYVRTKLLYTTMHPMLLDVGLFFLWHTVKAAC